MIFNSNVNIKNSPIKPGHERALEWFSSNSFEEIKNNYARVFGENRVYFRVTEKGVTVVSLDHDVPCFIGVRPAHKNAACYISTGESVKSLEYYADLKRSFEDFKRSVKRKSSEECAVVNVIQSALDNGLLIPEMNSYFLNNEWRFLDSTGKGKKTDLLAVNIQTRSLVIIEFKGNKGKLNQAKTQVREYADHYLRHQKEYDVFFEEQFRATYRLYGCSELPPQRILCGNPPDLYVAYPTSMERVVCFEGVD